ncbi:hypothetical protein JCM10908_003111 [Rhodotorula pacifica]|uniref:SH3 domain-containing protein n=1 Tax=Rhodotorula pacifica TaxID=1495444 RepID=UPI00317E236B
MDKFGSAFSQAKNYAEKGRSSITTQFDKIDKAVPIGSQRPRAGSGTASPSLAASGSYSGGGTGSATRPPPPPMRNASASGTGAPAPPTRNRTPSAATSASASAGGGGVFSAMLHDPSEKQAFFTLLDEYFSSRPQFAGLFSPSSSHVAPVAPAASRPTPPAPAPVSNGLGTATALYDFEGTQAEDLPFSTGDRITLTEIVSDDWLKGEVNGRSGIFPASYVQRS